MSFFIPIGIQPNGKATDFDSVIAGSIPAVPTKGCHRPEKTQFANGEQKGMNMEKSFEFLMQMLAPDTIFIPKTLLKRRDIGEDAKLLFSEIFTEHRFGTLVELRKALDDISDEYIEAYARNGSPAKLKSDLEKINVDLEKILLLSTEEGA